MLYAALTRLILVNHILLKYRGDDSDEWCENHEMLMYDQYTGYLWPGIRRY